MMILTISSGMHLSCQTSSKLKTFTSDGCSMFPDRSKILHEDWCECCLEHDKAYWRGGTREERRAADHSFKECILEKTNNKVLAELMYDGVRLGGSPYFPTWYRWGYGWDYGRGYKALSPEELELASKRMEEYELGNANSVCDSISYNK
jgi:hypothetical protein